MFREADGNEQVAAALANVISGGIVEVGQRDHGNAHLARGRRLHGFANHLCSGRDRDAVEFLAEGADQNRLPEACDGRRRLAVSVEPLLE